MTTVANALLREFLVIATLAVFRIVQSVVVLETFSALVCPDSMPSSHTMFLRNLYQESVLYAKYILRSIYVSTLFLARKTRLSKKNCW